MASTYLTKTLGTPTNNKKFTFSCWVKKNAPASTMDIFHAGAAGSDEAIMCRFEGEGYITIKHDSGSSQEMLKQTKAKYKDPNAWYHIVTVFDTDNSTAEDRQRIYVNGERITEWLSGSDDNFSQGDDVFANKATSHTIGKRNFDNNFYLDAVLSHVHFCDGQAYDASYFGSTDATTGEWKINTNPSVTYGNNGFFILKDGNSVTDQSGNGNNWSVGGGTLTKTEDCPSNVFATLNPLVNTNSNLTLSKGNNTMTLGSTSWIGTVSTLAIPKGKFYWEVKVNSNNLQHGILGETANMSDLSTSNSGYVGKTSNGYAFYWQSPNARKQNNNSHVSYGSSISNGDILMVAFDGDNGIIWVGKNGTWFNNATQTEIENGTTTNAMYSSIPTTEEYFVASAGESSHEANYNFGNGYFGTTAVASAGTNASGIGIFEYDVPTGYTALSTKGLNE